VLLAVRHEQDSIVVDIGIVSLPFWRDCWSVSYIEPILKHTPSLGSFSVGSRTYRLVQDARLEYEEYKPLLGIIYPRPLKLVLILPEKRVQIAMSLNEVTLSAIEAAMRSAISRWVNLGYVYSVV
jgi:hypothetical protein